jgi:hypothetical protein
LGAERTFLTFYTRLDGSGDYLHWRPVLDKKKINGQLRPVGKKGRFVEDNWTNCGQWRLTPFSYIGLIHTSKQIIGPTFTNYFK